MEKRYEFRGGYVSPIDDSGRVKLPQAFFDKIKVIEKPPFKLDAIVLKEGEYYYLCLFPQGIPEPLAQKIQDEQVQFGLEHFGLEELTIDEEKGTITIPERCGRDIAALYGDVKFIGYGEDYFEIWNKRYFEEATRGKTLEEIAKKIKLTR